MILIACATCGFTMRVEGDVKNDDRELDFLVGRSSSFWPDKYACAQCGAQALGLEVSQVTDRAGARLRIVDVTPHEAFAALQGLGLPEERSCHLEDVIKLLKEHGVKNAVGKDILGTSRCVIDYLELGDGSKMYLGPSTEGATVFRITKSVSYVKEVSRD